METFYKKAQVGYDQPQNYTVKGWFNLLKTKGPLIVDRLSFIDPEDNTIWTHVTVLVGIKLDPGNINNSSFIYLDPWDGKEHTVNFLTYLEKYEALPTNGAFKIQVAYATD